MGAVAHYLGILARFLGEKRTAREHFARAVAINRGLMPSFSFERGVDVAPCVVACASSCGGWPE